MTRMEKRFWSKVEKAGADECWEWQGATSDGYGYIRRDGKNRLAHRESYRIENGDVPDDMVLHHCDNPSCVNPAHLYSGDAKDNAQDRVNRGRSAPREETRQSKLSEEQVARIKWRLENTNDTQDEIAKEYDVEQAAISYISTGKRWWYVEPEKPGEA